MNSLNKFKSCVRFGAELRVEFKATLLLSIAPAEYRYDPIAKIDKQEIKQSSNSNIMNWKITSSEYPVKVLDSIGNL